MNKLFEFDRSFDQEIIIGVDEVGRGPLAGPVVSAAVVLSDFSGFTYLNDSKQLTEAKRNIAYKEIVSCAKSYAIAELDAGIIDEINILNAAQKTMIEAINKLNEPNGFVLVDGNLTLEIALKQLCIVKGDSKSASIAAASIIAKVYRDKLMNSYAKQYPEYEFEKNKGYGSKTHIEALKKYGPCPIHRKTFLKKILPDQNQMRIFL